MDQPRVQVLEEVHVAGVEAGVIVEIIRGGDGERDIRQLHDSAPHTPQKKKQIQRSSEEEQSGGAERRSGGSGFGGNVESCHKLFCPLSR